MGPKALFTKSKLKNSFKISKNIDKTLDYDHSIVDVIYFIMLYKVLITFKFVDETLKCFHVVQ